MTAKLLKVSRMRSSRKIFSFVEERPVGNNRCKCSDDFIPNDERIVLIEDTAKYRFRKITFFDSRHAENKTACCRHDSRLVESNPAAQARPYHLGEIRGGRLSTPATPQHGAQRTISTVTQFRGSGHFALYYCVLQSGVEMPYRAIKTNIADSLDIIIRIERRQACGLFPK